ncbi:hypothetical protein Zmor_001038 [Zophobas morio]|uniref:Uncharacterized protein n=1 Tax=Zophobas morio TaxID=2755281 RepID=A0AA38J682_9CUCU|nr:hypothetical protein Zmor_001038 [Zophobas morio]
MQKHDKGQSCVSWLPSCVRLTPLTMVNFPYSKRVDMVMFYGVVRKLWIDLFSNRASPCERILQSEEQILERVKEEPEIITHRLAAEVEVSQFVVHRTLNEQGPHPFHV